MSASSTLTIAAIAASENRVVTVADVGGAYLNALMTEEVLMTLSQFLSSRLVKLRPEYKKFLSENGTLTVKLLKALYGCVQSAKLWFETIRDILLSLGFIQNCADSCVFNCIEKDGSQTTIGVYVDDLLITSRKREYIESILASLRNAFSGEVTAHFGTIHNYLGMCLDFSRKGKVSINMKGYISKILRNNNITSSAKTPTSGKINFKSDLDSPPLSPEEMKKIHSLSAQLSYIASRARPDISFPVAYLTTKVGKYTENDKSIAFHLLKYLHGSIDRVIMISIPNTKDIKHFVDSSFYTHSDAKSHSGACLSLGNGFVCWKSSSKD